MKTFLICEIGCNWSSLSQAKALIKAAHYAGASAVKFQSFGPDFDPKLKKWSLDNYQTYALFITAQEYNLEFMSTVFDEDGFYWLSQIEIYSEKGEKPRYGKVPSGELTNGKYLDRVRNLFDHLFVSTGMASLSDVEKALVRMGWPGRKDFTLMHCISGYPPDIKDVNLKAMETLVYAFKLPVGLSDHTQSVSIPAAAVAMGACAIEKHIKADEQAIDADVSLTPQQFMQMADNIREVEDALGDGIKMCAPSEFGTLAKRDRYK